MAESRLKQQQKGLFFCIRKRCGIVQSALLTKGIYTKDDWMQAWCIRHCTLKPMIMSHQIHPESAKRHTAQSVFHANCTYTCSYRLHYICSDTVPLTRNYPICSIKMHITFWIKSESEVTTGAVEYCPGEKALLWLNLMQGSMCMEGTLHLCMLYTHYWEWILLLTKVSLLHCYCSNDRWWYRNTTLNNI